MWWYIQSAVPAIGLTSVDQRQPGAKTCRPTSTSSRVKISTRPLVNERISSGFDRNLRWRRAIWPDRTPSGGRLAVRNSTSVAADWATVRAMRGRLIVEPMTDADWPDVRRIYAEGIATHNATLEREAPDWNHFDHSHRHDCRLVARAAAGGPILGWTALTAYSSRRVYAGVAWESVYVAAGARGQGVGHGLLEALIPASEAAGLWTLLAGVL